MKRPKFGDVIEFDAGEGLACARYSHRDQMWGYLPRVFSRMHPERLAN